ncbi:MAG: hypothetical protein Q7T17_07100, partial [Microbacterium sp.]
MGDALELVVAGVGPYLDRMLVDHAVVEDGVPVVDRDLVGMLGVLAGAPTFSGDEATSNAMA